MFHFNFTLLLSIILLAHGISERQRRYLLFTPNTQYGVIGTVSIPLSEPDNLVSVAWYFEAQYYNVANASYFEPLLGDIVVCYSSFLGVKISRSRQERESIKRNEIFTRSTVYTLVENMLTKHGYPGRWCLLRSICESATTQFSHNGLLGDLIQLILTPSLSLPEDDLHDCYYEAEYYGLDNACRSYHKRCPSSPLDDISMYIDHLL